MQMEKPGPSNRSDRKGALLRVLTLVFCCAQLCAFSIDSHSATYSIRDYGAKGDGQTSDTAAIQAAIEACANAGGGTVLFPPGRFLSGTIFLRSHVTLEFDTGSTLLGGTRLEDYPLTLCAFASYTDRYCGRALIWGEGLEDVGIVGRGTIDGQGAAFKDNRPSDEVAAEIAKDWTDPSRHVPKGVYINRPYLIRLVSCSGVRVEGLTLRDSAMWMQHYLNCDFVAIRGITVYNHCAANNDMIDIDCCREVLISDCFGDTDDDALTLKSTADCPTENVTVTNCALSSHCNAIKLGTESSGGFKNITISNCVIRPSRDREAMAGRNEGLAGIALEMVDGGSLERVAISNVAMYGQTTPIFIRLGNRARPFKTDMEKPGVGTLRDVILGNIVATGAGGIGCSITGLPDHPVENVTLSNIRIEYKGGVARLPKLSEVPEVPEKYPESAMFGTLPAYGLYCRHVKGLRLESLDLATEKHDARPALACEDVRDLELARFRGSVSPSVPMVAVFKDVSDALISGCVSPEVATFLRFEEKVRQVRLTGNDLSRAGAPFEAVAGADAKEVIIVGDR
ncbi:MAG: hypothetical protein GHCLOJNM_02758 [bacterium]|nr:hypothetical protein [bacterium]